VQKLAAVGGDTGEHARRQFVSGERAARSVQVLAARRNDAAPLAHAEARDGTGAAASQQPTEGQPTEGREEGPMRRQDRGARGGEAAASPRAPAARGVAARRHAQPWPCFLILPFSQMLLSTRKDMTASRWSPWNWRTCRHGQVK